MLILGIKASCMKTCRCIGPLLYVWFNDIKTDICIKVRIDVYKYAIEFFVNFKWTILVLLLFRGRGSNVKTSKIAPAKNHTET